MPPSTMKSMVFFLVLVQAVLSHSASSLPAETEKTALFSQTSPNSLWSQSSGLSTTFTIEAPKAGYPWVNLTAGRALIDSQNVKGLKKAAKPLSMVAGDFNQDGTPDLAVGYGTATGGFVVLYWGNPDAIYPNNPEAQARKALGTFTETPFLSSGLTFEVPVPPDFMEACDLDGDGNLDLLVAAQGKDTIYLLHGDGKGNLGRRTETKLPGIVTALTVEASRHGGALRRIAVGIKGEKGANILIFGWPKPGKLTQFEKFGAADKVRQLLFAGINGSPGSALLAASGSELKVIHAMDHLELSAKQGWKGKIQKGESTNAFVNGTEKKDSKRIPTSGQKAAKRKVERFSMPFKIADMVHGNFVWEKENVDELALISTEGEIHIYQIPGKSGMGASLRSMKSAVLKAQKSSDFRLIRAKVSGLSVDDLLVFDKVENDFQILLGDGSALQTHINKKLPEPFSRLTLSALGAPVAALPMRLNPDPLSDLVILLSGAEIDGGPSVILTDYRNVFTVTSTSMKTDCNPGDGVCLELIGADEEGNPICGDACTLPAALIEAAYGAGSTLIRFNLPGQGLHVINAGSPFVIGSPTTITIDGTTQPGYAGVPVIELRNSGVEVLYGQTVIRGLVINGANYEGVVSNGIYLITEGNIVEGNYIGTDASGNAVASQPNVGNGVLIENFSNNTIGGATTAARNVISGNKGSQVAILGGKDNKVQGNYIGTNSKGDTALFESKDACVSIESSQKNQILGNVVSGCSIGVKLTMSDENIVGGNKIGTNVKGDAVLEGGEREVGVFVQNGTLNRIGGLKEDSNLVSGWKTGIQMIEGERGTEANLIMGNFIGTNDAGDSVLGNGLGVEILGAKTKMTEVDGNLISGSGYGKVSHPSGAHGIYIKSSTLAKVHGNYIGINARGDKVLGNKDYGVRIVDSDNNSIGYYDQQTDEIHPNVISGNSVGVGIISEKGKAQKNWVESNAIGMDKSRNMVLGNEQQGVLIYGVQATNNYVSLNMISGSGHIGPFTTERDGVLIQLGSNNKVFNNGIGTNAEGTVTHGNKDAGIRIIDGSDNKVGVHGTNMIAGNYFGVVIQSRMSYSKKNQIKYNFIGAYQKSKTQIMLTGNGGDGIVIEGENTSENEINTNFILESGRDKQQPYTNAIHIRRSNNNSIKKNLIGLNHLGAGIRIWNASSNVVGGLLEAGEENKIMSDNALGVAIIAENAVAQWNVIAGNYIGVTRELQPIIELLTYLGDIGDYIILLLAVIDYFSWISADIPPSYTIESNHSGGLDQVQTVLIRNSSAQKNSNRANPIPVRDIIDPYHEIAPNKNQGVLISGSGATDNTIRGNIIGGGGYATGATAGLGVGIHLENCEGNKIVGNAIGTDFNGYPTVLSNKDHGIMIVNASDNMIGTLLDGESNRISYNCRDGIFIESGVRNFILTNSIACNEGIGIDLAPGGVTPNDTRDADSGPNELQNFPELKSATYLGTSTVIAGSLNSKPNTTYTLQFYANYSDCDPGGLVELGKFLGLVSKTTDQNGDIPTFAFQVATQISKNRFIRATATDPLGNTSEFSNYIQVSESRQDDDGDGLPNVIEDLGPNGGDGNGDGIPDSQQPNVATTLSPTGQGFITMVTSGGCNQVQNFQSLTETPNDPLYDYPFGLIEFTLPCTNAMVKLIYHEATNLDGFSYRQYGPMPPNRVVSQWYTLSNAAFSTVTIKGRVVGTVTYNLVDGGRGDTSGVDGAITVHSGPGWPQQQPPGVIVPAMTEWGMFILALILVLQSLRYVSKRRHRLNKNSEGF